MVPAARSLYPEDFTAFLDQQRLQSLKRTDFHTHTSVHAERLHRLSEAILLPARWSAQLLGCIIQPLAGEDKDRAILGLAYRILSLALFIILLPLTLVSLCLGLPLRFMDHTFRPIASHIDYSASTDAQSKELKLTRDHPLHIRSHNVGPSLTANRVF